MTDNQDNINQLVEKLDDLLKRQNDFSREIHNIKLEINKLKNSQVQAPTDKKVIEKDESSVKSKFDARKEAIREYYNSRQQEKPQKKTLRVKSDLEKFVGENLINKIGIAITVIGVAIGAKYSIDNDLISPLTRVILGYLTGLGLLGFGMKLKKDYENYSAVLVSGAMAIMYFITYSAYDFYSLIPVGTAFGLMAVFTAFTVTAAINYNRQVIAHIGLVGAYAVPLLLSEGSGQVAFLFTYISIINIGILLIAFKKYWKPLHYTSFGLTWLLYLAWYKNTDGQFETALTFNAIFFVTFYATFLAYKLIKKEKFINSDIILLLFNSFIFYGIGFSVLNEKSTGEQLLGVFTLCNAAVHFVISTVIYRQKLADKKLFYLISGLVLVFVTITIPVQLDGNWVTLIWAGEAALLFWIGRTKEESFYEMISYRLIILAFISFTQDWAAYDNYNIQTPEVRITPLLNIHFLTSILFIGAFTFINVLNRDKTYTSPLRNGKGFLKFMSLAIPGILLLSIYLAFRLEIVNYWDQLYKENILNSGGSNYINYDLNAFKTIWIINYNLLFVSLLALVNFKKLKNRKLGLINLGLITLSIGIFLIQGLYILSELRESYLDQDLSQYYKRDFFNIGIRYVSLTFVALSLVACRKYLRQEFMQRDFKVAFDVLLHISTLWILSSELINWMDLTGSSQSYKLGLSILWGIYSLFLIALGIWKNIKYLRIGAIALFGVTLVKLFLYDIADLDTIAKTIVFISLGILLLIISFWYNKYKHRISNE